MKSIFSFIFVFTVLAQPALAQEAGAVPSVEQVQVEAGQLQAQPTVTEAAPESREAQLAAYLQTGKKYLEAKRYGEAVKYFDYVAKTDPGNIQAWKSMAFCYYGNGNHKYAYALFTKVLQLDKNDKDAKQFMDFYAAVIEKSKNKFEKREFPDSLWRSVVMPGWGQFYNNQGIKGLITGGGFFVAGGLTIFNIWDEIGKYHKYVITNQNQEIAFQQAQDAYNNALILGLITGAFYIYGIVDAAVNYNCEDARLASAGFKDGKFCLAYNFRW